MEILKWAFFRCWPLGASCEVNWDAWAAAGGWVAACVTFLAVLLPFRQFQKSERERNRVERFEAALELEHFWLTTIDLKRLLNPAAFADAGEEAENRLRFLINFTRGITYPALPTSSEYQSLRSALAQLKRTLKVLQDFDSIHKPTEHDALREQLRRVVEQCAMAVEDVSVAMLPLMREQAQRAAREAAKLSSNS
ncbi:hypothetical protein [Xanthomonas campestris]|uniref:hypothetical protein n=1 Tax=Xanthomonas campestris TaxID=339 RepID=UPI000E1E8BF7|nr:hypothetical protein [Xanthomonas campestris]